MTDKGGMAVGREKHDNPKGGEMLSEEILIEVQQPAERKGVGARPLMQHHYMMPEPPYERWTRPAMLGQGDREFLLWCGIICCFFIVFLFVMVVLHFVLAPSNTQAVPGQTTKGYDVTRSKWAKSGY